ncbi:MAG: hypothetical protein AB8B73_00045 [Ekhidna sp.]
MKNRSHNRKDSSINIFSSAGFVTGLFILFGNDFFLKGMFHNWVTGKLSDFAGLFVFAIFWAALLPKKSKLIYVGVAVFFIFWKSPLSQPLINTINEITFLHYVRVIDWTDLMALSVLPFAFWFQFNYSSKTHTYIPAPLSIAFASFLFIATSSDEVPEEIVIDKSYELSFPHDSLYIKLNRIDSVILSSRDSIPRDSTSFYISYHSYNCERRLLIYSNSYSLTEGTCQLNLDFVLEGPNCYKVPEEDKVEQSIRNLLMEIDEEIIDKLE